VYIIDSVKKVEHVHVAGYLSNVFKNEKNIFSAEGLFLNSTYNFQGNSSELNWVIDGEEKVINGYACKKATLSNSPDVTVWFTTAIPVNSGPEFYYGLPGLVIEADSYFEKCEASKITYDVKVSDFDALVKKETIALENKKQISLKEAVLSKQNFIQMIEKQSAEKNNN
jgi:GLPGLI family protein